MKRILTKLSFFTFRLFSRIGVFLLPAHYYVPLADVNHLEITKETWAKKSDLPGIDPDLDAQVHYLQKVCLPFQKEYEHNRAYTEGVKQHFGPGYGYIEAQALHGFIRYHRPKKIIEVGSGVSSHCMFNALEMNRNKHNIPFQLTCIEPYPSDQLRSYSNITLIEERAQSIPVEVFTELKSGDFLFIDSTHTVKPGGDVNYLILEVLPRLSTGVMVHFHDIYLPYDYPRHVLKSYFQWMETSLLRAFLIHNPKAQILFCLSQLHYGRSGALKEVFPEYQPSPDVNGLETGRRTDTKMDHYPASLFFEIS